MKYCLLASSHMLPLSPLEGLGISFNLDRFFLGKYSFESLGLQAKFSVAISVHERISQGVGDDGTIEKSVEHMQ